MQPDTPLRDRVLPWALDSAPLHLVHIPLRDFSMHTPTTSHSPVHQSVPAEESIYSFDTRGPSQLHSPVASPDDCNPHYNRDTGPTFAASTIDAYVPSHYPLNDTLTASPTFPSPVLDIASPDKFVHPDDVPSFPVGYNQSTHTVVDRSMTTAETYFPFGHQIDPHYSQPVSASSAIHPPFSAPPFPDMSLSALPRRGAHDHPRSSPSTKNLVPRDVFTHPYARLYNRKKNAENKRRKLWNHAFEKLVFTSEEMYVSPCTCLARWRRSSRSSLNFSPSL